MPSGINITEPHGAGERGGWPNATKWGVAAQQRSNEPSRNLAECPLIQINKPAMARNEPRISLGCGNPL